MSRGLIVASVGSCAVGLWPPSRSLYGPPRDLVRGLRLLTPDAFVRGTQVFPSINCTGPAFRSIPLPMVLQADLRARGLWTEQCPAPLNRLRLLQLSYYDFSGQVRHDGEMIVLDVVAPQVMQIFRGLFVRKFPLERMRLTSEYDGDDARSMAANNSSAFTCREITGGGRWSLHAYGLAIDINPRQNPYIGQWDETRGTALVLPPAGVHYLNRTNLRPGMVEPIVDLFAAYGFSWGLADSKKVDWQHFEIRRAVADRLVALPFAAAQRYFREYCDFTVARASGMRRA